MNKRLAKAIEKVLAYLPDLPAQPKRFAEHGDVYYIPSSGELVVDVGLLTPDNYHAWVLVGNEKDLPPNWLHLKYDRRYNRFTAWPTLAAYKAHAQANDLTDTEEYQWTLDNWKE